MFCTSSILSDRSVKKTGRLNLCSIAGRGKIFLAVLSHIFEITDMALLSDNIGLCKECRYHRVIKNDRGNTFYLCWLAASDPRFPKYPRLPVWQCAGYAPRPEKLEPKPEPQTNNLPPTEFERPQE